jgi:hypothetical protein
MHWSFTGWTGGGRTFEFTILRGNGLLASPAESGRKTPIVVVAAEGHGTCIRPEHLAYSGSMRV